jgi:hypothetical protein
MARRSDLVLDLPSMSYLVERTGPVFPAYFRGWEVYPTFPRWGRSARRAHECRTLTEAEQIVADCAAIGIETHLLGAPVVTIPVARYPLLDPGP